jgi:hypothetical protein
MAGLGIRQRILLRLAIVLPVAIGLLAGVFHLVTIQTAQGRTIADLRRISENHVGAAIENGIIWVIVVTPVVWMLYGLTIFVLKASETTPERNRASGQKEAETSQA